MEKQKIQEFTRRISQDNRSGLVVTMYDIMFAYFEDAECAYEEKDHTEFKTAVRHVDRVLQQLEDSLNFEYELSNTLYPLYVYCREELAKSLIKYNLEGITNAKTVLSSLRESFRVAASKDTSEPLMRNTQQIYAGITYGKNDLNENFQDPETSRGFLV